MFDRLLEKYNLKFDDLNTAERETLLTWAKSLQTTTLTPDDIKKYVTGLITAIERELAGLDEPQTFWQWLFRRRRLDYRAARLQNYLMIRDFLEGPEKAKAFIEAHLQRFPKT